MSRRAAKSVEPARRLRSSVGSPEGDRANADGFDRVVQGTGGARDVVDEVAETLLHLCEGLTWDDEPVLRETPNVWHLSTRFRGALREPAPTA